MPTSTQYASSNYGSTRITHAVQRLIVLNVGIFALLLLVDPFLPVPDLRHLLAVPAGGLAFEWLGFKPADFLPWQLWRPFTYMFLHGGLMHLFLNMLWLFFFGPEVERTLGTRGFYKFYIICGALAVLMSMFALLLFGTNNAIVGASGAIMAVLVAFAMIDPERQFFLFPLPIPINARGIVILVLLMNVLSAAGNTNVSVSTHLGGMAVGYLYMKFLPRLNEWRRQRRFGMRRRGPKGKGSVDKVGQAVDNIFNFKDRRR